MTHTETETETQASSIRVKAHPGLCEGWGECARWAPGVYHLDDDGKIDIHMMEVPPELADPARWGASSCPAKAISIIENFSTSSSPDTTEPT